MRTGSSAGTRWIVIALASLVAAFASVLVSAQTYQGGIRGVVEDAQGVVPGVEVTLVNEATNAVRSVTTNEAGNILRPACCRRPTTIRLAPCRIQDRRAHPAAARDAAGHHHGLHARGGARRADHRHRRDTVVERASASVATTMTAAQITAIPLSGRQHVPHRDRHARRDHPATRSSCATRTSPERRCCRLAAGRAAATRTPSRA